MLKGKLTIFIDQYGNVFKARTLKDLKENMGCRGKISKMYCDVPDKEGKTTTYHIGYVIGDHWLTAYTNCKEPINQAKEAKSSEDDLVPLFCPSCLNESVEYVDCGDERDSEGVFGNHIYKCNVCGRQTNAMDTKEDAAYAWNNHEVHFVNSETILISKRTLDFICERCQIRLDSDIPKDLRNVEGRQ